MGTSSAAIRGGALVCVLLAFTASTASANEAPRHAYSIRASLTPAAAQTTTATGNGLQLTGTLRTATSAIPVQSGGGMELTAKLAYAPLTCYADTIFRDSFEP
ncbi:MAG: hypothetical protein ABI866_06545 [Dokdonella sp.]